MKQPVRKYDGTIARIAGNLLSGDTDWVVGGQKREWAVKAAVETARAIVAEVERTQPTTPEEP